MPRHPKQSQAPRYSNLAIYAKAKVEVLAKIKGKSVKGVWTVLSSPDLAGRLIVGDGRNLINVHVDDLRVVTGGGKRRKNPGHPAEVEHGRREYEAKHWGIPAKKARTVEVPAPKGALVEMGTVRSIAYDTNKKGDGHSTYVHDFGGQKPKLAFDTRKGKKRLFLVGGSYDVKDRGIVG